LTDTSAPKKNENISDKVRKHSEVTLLGIPDITQTTPNLQDSSGNNHKDAPMWSHNLSGCYRNYKIEKTRKIANEIVQKLWVSIICRLQEEIKESLTDKAKSPRTSHPQAKYTVKAIQVDDEINDRIAEDRKVTQVCMGVERHKLTGFVSTVFRWQGHPTLCFGEYLFGRPKIASDIRI